MRATQQFSHVFLLPISSSAPDSAGPSMVLLWRSWAVRRILVHRVIVSLILAPRWARRPTIAVRRILVISPESSLHAHKAVLVFARARMCGHLPLVAPPNAHRESLRLFSIVPQFIEKSTEHMLGGRPFFFSGTILSMGRCDLVHNEFRPCGDPNFLQSKVVLVG